MEVGEKKSFFDGSLLLFVILSLLLVLHSYSGTAQYYLKQECCFSSPCDICTLCTYRCSAQQTHLVYHNSSLTIELCFPCKLFGLQKIATGIIVTSTPTDNITVGGALYVCM